LDKTKKQKRIPTKTLIIVFLLFLVIGLSILNYHFYKIAYISQPISEVLLDHTQTSTDESKINSIKKQPISIDNLIISGWIPDWDIPRGLEALKLNSNSLKKEISIVLFNANNDGTLKHLTTDSTALNYSIQNNITVIPTITIANSLLLHNILKDPLIINKHINEIIKEVSSNNYDGIDLDYEYINYEDKESFYQLLSGLSTKLHAINKIFIYTSVSKWSDNITYWGLIQTRKVLDYKRISNLVDELRIMAYEYYGKGSNKAGPLSPINWNERIIKYTISVGVPREKIMLAIPLYAYDWPEIVLAENTIDFINIDPLTVNTDGTDNPDTLSYRAVQTITKKYNMQITFNNSWGQSIGIYTFEGKKRTIVFGDQHYIDLRKQLAADYGIKGIMYWKIGDNGTLKL